MPEFVGSDGNNYGPYKEQDVVKLPDKDALLLFEQNYVTVL